MDAGEIITRGTVWLALLCYLAALLSWRRSVLARTMWAVGCAFFLTHVAAAFHFFHHWSHAAAAADTDRQTLEQVGVSFRGGLYFNYLFALLWLVDCAALLPSGKLLQENHFVWRRVLHAFFLFMIFNATVVFGHGWAKPVGGLLCFVALMSLWQQRRAGVF